MERLVLVHGSVGNGAAAWDVQAELADAYELVVLDRPGYPPNPPLEAIDFEEQGVWLAGLLRPGDHLCGHSYGGIVCLQAAALAERLASLTVIEPPAFGVAAGVPEVDALVERLAGLWADPPDEPREFLGRFYAIVAGRPVEVPDPLPPALERGTRALIVERHPWEADPPLAAIAASSCPALVVSGGWSPAFEAVADALEHGLSAERAVLPGSGHAVQRAPGFSERLRRFLARAAAAAG